MTQLRILKDPYVFEFHGLKEYPEYLESELKSGSLTIYNNSCWIFAQDLQSYWNFLFNET